MTRKRRRLYFVIGGVALLGLAVGLMLSALSDNLVFFYGPSDLYAEHIPPGRLVRIGGLVAAGSVKHEADGSTLDFTVTDGRKSVPVTYRGTVPDLFREGQGVVVEGRLTQKLAKEVLPGMKESGDSPAVIVEREGLKQISDTGALEKMVDDAIAANPRQVEQYRGGKTTVIGILVGQVMKASLGQANPAAVNDILKTKLG